MLGIDEKEDPKHDADIEGCGKDDGCEEKVFEFRKSGAVDGCDVSGVDEVIYECQDEVEELDELKNEGF